jgi:hypothetical protein
VIPYDPLGPFCVENKIQLIFFVVVQREVESCFHPGEDHEAIVLGQGGDFPDNIRIHVPKIQYFGHSFTDKVLKKYWSECRCLLSFEHV